MVAGVLVARHPRGQQRAIRGHQSAQVIGSIERDRRPQVELRAAVEQIGGDLLAHIAEAGCPTEHAAPVIVAFAVDVGAGLDQQPNRLQIAMCCCKMQRGCIVRKVATVEIGTALDQ